MLYDFDSKVFGESSNIRDNLKLKDIRPVREAFVLNELSHLPQNKLKKFVKSPEARTMVEMEIISPDALESLTKDAYGDRAAEFMVCHMAKENGDDRWDELVRLRAQERALMNSLLRDYCNHAAPYCKNYRNDFVNNNVPKEYLTGE